MANFLLEKRFSFAGMHVVLRVAMCLMVASLMIGCQGKSLVDSDPVFSNAPPRRSLTNKATVMQTRGGAADSLIKAVSYDTSSTAPLTGNTVVAEVNGSPIFVDDLIASVRLALESHDEIPDHDKRRIMLVEIQKSLGRYIDQEVVIQSLNAAIPEEQRKTVDDALNETFDNEVIPKMKSDKSTATDEQLQQVLAEEGLSIELLKEFFVRGQKVKGYLYQKAAAPKKVDRADIVEFYRENIDKFTTEESLRWQELVLSFDQNGGKQEAAKKMLQLIQQLKAGARFEDLAEKYSDALSSEKNGEMGWLSRDSLADKELEKELWGTPPGQTTNIYERDSQLELYRVVEHRRSKTLSLQEAQHQIEFRLKEIQQREANQVVLEKLKEQANIVTIFDEAAQKKETAKNPFAFDR